MPRFVLLRHELPPGAENGSHYDFMLERDDALLTWSLAELPWAWMALLAADPGQYGESHHAGKSGSGAIGLPVGETGPADPDFAEAIRLPDHRLTYLDYEGPISGNRGTVTRIDRGDYRQIKASDFLIAVQLSGEILDGSVLLELKLDPRWRLTLAR
jgi:hypothetical protein